MVQPENVAAALAPEPAILVFEQPLNERMRTFLRLDYLYSQALHHNEKASQWGSRAAVASLIDILAISSRSDIRSDVLKELERHLILMQDFQNRPGVDTARLRALVANLTRLRAALAAAGNSYLQPLRDSEFLAAIRHRSAIPGGTCEFDLPDYFYWLNQDAESRVQTFNEWLSMLRPLCDAIAELLWLTRQNGRSRIETAQDGCFSISFERDLPVQMLRVSVSADERIYPEISGNQHRCSVRFLTWNGLMTRATQAQGTQSFTLTCCN
jgi:cell division protein ZapD